VGHPKIGIVKLSGFSKGDRLLQPFDHFFEILPEGACENACLLSTMLDSTPSICSFGFSIFSTTWGVCFSVKASPNETNE
jgi:hypothetical protein